MSAPRLVKLSVGMQLLPNAQHPYHFGVNFAGKNHISQLTADDFSLMWDMVQRADAVMRHQLGFAGTTIYAEFKQDGPWTIEVIPIGKDQDRNTVDCVEQTKVELYMNAANKGAHVTQVAAAQVSLQAATIGRLIGIVVEPSPARERYEINAINIRQDWLTWKKELTDEIGSDGAVAEYLAGDEPDDARLEVKDECVFCPDDDGKRVVDHQLAAEGAEMMALVNRTPCPTGSDMLIVPKGHEGGAYMSEAQRNECLVMLQRLAKAWDGKRAYFYARIGTAAGQRVHHLTFHATVAPVREVKAVHALAFYDKVIPLTPNQMEAETKRYGDLLAD